MRMLCDIKHSRCCSSVFEHIRNGSASSHLGRVNSCRSSTKPRRGCVPTALRVQCPAALSLPWLAAHQMRPWRIRQRNARLQLDGQTLITRQGREHRRRSLVDNLCF